MKKVLVAGLVVVLAIAGFMAFKMLQPPPEDLDLRAEHPSVNNLYTVSFLPEAGAAQVGPIQTFLVTVKDADGNLVSGATVAVDGSMPQHGHGLPSVPQTEGEIQPGVYRVDGVKFSMGGWWEFKLVIDGPKGNDSATFNLVLE